MARIAAGVGDRIDGIGGFDREFWALSAVVVTGAAMSILSTTSINVALTTLASEFRVSLTHAQWVATAYPLALATVIPLTGWATERFGPRRVWIVTVSLFGATSVACGLAWSIDTLIVARVLQGLAGGMMMPVGMIIITVAVGPPRIGRAMSLIGVPMLLSPAFGPVLGGVLVEYVGWRWIFYWNVPAAIAGVMLAARLLPQVAVRRERSLDWLGLVLVSPGLAALTFGLAEIPVHGSLADPSVYVPLCAGIALLAGFTRHALRVPEPLIDVRLFLRSRIGASLVTTLLLGATLFGSLVILPLYFQILRGEDAFTTGLLLVPSGIGGAAVMPFTGPLTERYGGGSVVVGGIIVLAAGTLALALAGPDTPYWLLSLVLLVRGFGLGACFMPAMAAGYAALSVDDIPRATSAMNVMQRVGGAFGAAFLVVLLQTKLQTTGDRGATASAFRDTFISAFLLAVIVLPPALKLAIAERRAARAERLRGATEAKAEIARLEPMG